MLLLSLLLSPLQTSLAYALAVAVAVAVARAVRLAAAGVWSAAGLRSVTFCWQVFAYCFSLLSPHGDQRGEFSTTPTRARGDVCAAPLPTPADRFGVCSSSMAVDGVRPQGAPGDTALLHRHTNL